ncbi:MAG: hypothetical protein NTV14_03385 [Coprothermobacterota bacterium]|nr:hypothetical protein [Coprothermobacterota bacterium]
MPLAIVFSLLFTPRIECIQGVASYPVHLRVLAGLLTPPAKLYYWRQRTGEKVDIVVEYGWRSLTTKNRSLSSIACWPSPGQRLQDMLPQADKSAIMSDWNTFAALSGQKKREAVA